MPPLVHLDSQDYSKLSDPLALTAGLQEVKRRLSGYAERGEAIFISSSVLISEISPLDHNAVDHAKRRAELLGVFCGRKTFRSLDNLVKKELASYGGISINRDDLIPEDGEWFPDIGEIIYESDAKFDLWTKMKQELSEATNRHKRRAIKKMLMRKGLMREAPLTNLLHETNSIDMGGLRARYPMKEADLRTLILHKLGHRSRKEAESAFISSFQDPVWMIQWFRKCPMELNVIPEFCRKPAGNYVIAYLVQPIVLLKCGCRQGTKGLIWTISCSLRIGGLEFLIRFFWGVRRYYYNNIIQILMVSQKCPSLRSLVRDYAP
jgi:hypothetical protein